MMDLTKSKISLFEKEKIEERIPDEIQASRDFFLPVNSMPSAYVNAARRITSTFLEREDSVANNRKLNETLLRDSQRLRQLMYRR